MARPSLILSLLLVTLPSIFTGDDGLSVQQLWSVNSFCFRRLNDTHETGCTSSFNGNVGVVHRVATQADIDYVTVNGPGTHYVAIMNYSFMSTRLLDTFARFPRVVGVVLAQSGPPPAVYSSEDSCPNRQSSFYEDLTKCQWNSIENNPMEQAAHRNYPFPIFIAPSSNASAKIAECFDRFNLKTKDTLFSKRKCALKLYAPMSASGNSKLCLSRSAQPSYFTYPVRYCDPLGDASVFGVLKAQAKVELRSTLLLAGRMDSSSMFSGLAPGGDSAVSNIITILSVADTLRRVETASPGTLKKNVLFALVNGEAFDYIGSSRLVLDLQEETFKYNITMANISSVIEVNQVFAKSPLWYAHVDANQKKDTETGKDLERIVKSLSVGSNVKEVAGQVPPASIQSFLKTNKEIPVVVITNHEDKYINKYYNSIFDDYGVYEKDNATVLDNIATLVGTLSRTILAETSDSAKDVKDHVDKDFISRIYECFMKDSNCSEFREITDKNSGRMLRNEPYPLYVTVGNYPMTINPVTQFSFLLMARHTGKVVEGVDTQEECSKLHKSQPRVNEEYRWMNYNGSGICVAHNASMMAARSPAYDSDRNNTSRYSSWTESVWQNVEMTLFVQTSMQIELISFFLGLVILVTSLILGILVNRHAGDVFEPCSPVAC